MPAFIQGKWTCGDDEFGKTQYKMEISSYIIRAYRKARAWRNSTSRMPTTIIFPKMPSDDEKQPMTVEDAAQLRARYSGLFGLCAIARHHGLDLELKQLMHEHAVAVEEPPMEELARIARKHSFKAKLRKLAKMLHSIKA